MLADVNDVEVEDDFDEHYNEDDDGPIVSLPARAIEEVDAVEDFDDDAAGARLLPSVS